MNVNYLTTLLLCVVTFTSFANTTDSPIKDSAKKKQINYQISDKPNIVFVITDDQGYGDLSSHGNPIVRTPNIDQLGKESVSLINYHVAPTCAPTRAGLLTGRWNNRTGVWHTIMGRSMLRENEKTLADLLKVNGYQTAMFGKWHLGDNYPYRPHDRGFDLAYYHGGGGVGQTPDHWNNAYFDDTYMRNDVKEQGSGFVTDVLFDEAISYIDMAKDNDKPFFAYISTNAPHGPMHAPKEYADIYKNKTYKDKKLSVPVQHFLGMITNIDDNVAKLRQYLADNNLTENTIFIFTTDNGTSTGDKIFNAGMNGKKGSAFDGGHRVPFFIHWPAGKLNKPVKQNTITSFVDVVPTLLDLTQSNNTLAVNFDGVSIKPLLFSTESSLSNEPWPDRVIFTDSQRVLTPKKWRKSAVMTNRWRLIDGKKLYDMTKDPSQQNNIAKANPEIVQNLRKAYENWWQDISTSFAEPTAIHIGDNEANPVSLTSHDWLGNNAKVPWQQRSIRQAIREKDGKHKGYWYLDIKAAGQYKITLSRWPLEVETAITSGMPAGATVAGSRAFRATTGQAFNAVTSTINIAKQSQSKAVAPNDVTVEYELSLPKGKTKLVATFADKDQQELGAYYVQVEKLNERIN